MSIAAVSITRQMVADTPAAHLLRKITLKQLVNGSELVLMDGASAEAGVAARSRIVSRLDVTDVCASGLTWEDGEGLLRKTGFTARVEGVAA